MTLLFMLFFAAGFLGLLGSVVNLQHAQKVESPEPPANSWFHRWASCYFLGVAVLSLLALAGMLRVQPAGMTTWAVLLHTLCGAGLQLTHAAVSGYRCHRLRRALAAKNFGPIHPMLKV